jgi:hypothetical protein
MVVLTCASAHDLDGAAERADAVIELTCADLRLGVSYERFNAFLVGSSLAEDQLHADQHREPSLAGAPSRPHATTSIEKSRTVADTLRRYH